MAKKLSTQQEEKADKYIAQAREKLKKSRVIKKIFKQYKRDINEIDSVSIEFDPDLDVSAKTINGDIKLNAEMLDEPLTDNMRYFAHELTHYLQHTSPSTEKEDEVNQESEYLDKPAEQEAFSNQLDFMEEAGDSKKDIGEYLKQLFDRHDLSRKERKEKLEELL